MLSIGWSSLLLPLLDRLRLTDDVLGGGVGAGELRGVFFLDFLRSGGGLSDLMLAFDEEAELAALSCNTGRFGSLVRGLEGSGTVCDLLLVLCTIHGDADDHEVGVVVVVEALQGLGEAVNWVDGLLNVLIVLIAGVGLRYVVAAKACNSGISLGGKFDVC